MGGGTSKQKIHNNDSEENKSKQQQQDDDINVVECINTENDEHNYKRNQINDTQSVISKDMQSSISSPQSNRTLHINSNPKSNFQQNKKNKPDQPKNFKIRESKASILQVDDGIDFDSNGDNDTFLNNNSDIQSRERTRKKRVTQFLQEKQQEQKQILQQQQTFSIKRTSKKRLHNHSNNNNNQQSLECKQSSDEDNGNQNEIHLFSKNNQRIQRQQQQSQMSNHSQMLDSQQNPSMVKSQKRISKQSNNDSIYSPVKLQKKKNNHIMYEEDSPTLPRSQSGLVGLINIGNTCFMNSILQCMFNLPVFNSLFLSNQFKQQLISKHKGLAKSYNEVILKIRKKGNSGAENPSVIKKSIEKFSLQFKGSSQQDAQEFLVTLLDGLHEELNRGKKPKYKELEADINKNTLQEISEDWFSYYKLIDDSHIQDFFCGQLLSKVICQHCQNESLAFDNFLDLSLSFSRAIRMVEDPQIQRLFQWYLTKESLDDEYYCSKCKKHRKCQRELTLWKLPNILVLHIKRFHYGRTKREKINHKVKFPIKNLDLSAYVEQSPDPTTHECLYDLVGIVNHVGNLYGGHYFAECRNPIDKRWYCFNDSNVSEININQQNYETTGSAQPYILFYAKKSLLKNNNPNL